MTLGELIRDRRKALNISQAVLGERVGQSQTTVSGWERGDIASMRNPEKLAEVLGVPVENIVALMTEAAIESDKTQRLTPPVRDLVVNLDPDRNEDLSKDLNKLILDSGGSAAARTSPKVNVYLNSVQARRARERVLEDGSHNIQAIEKPYPTGERDIPVLGRAQGGPDGKFIFNGEVLGWELRPPMLEGVREAFAVYVDGESMYPRYKPGETVWVNPNKPARRGDDVVVQILPDEDGESPSGFIKEFKGWHGNDLVLQQYNPMKEIKVHRKTVKTVHTIVFAQRS